MMSNILESRLDLYCPQCGCGIFGSNFPSPEKADEKLLLCKDMGHWAGLATDCLSREQRDEKFGVRESIYTSAVKPPIPDYCKSGNCSCACIAAARETFDKGYDARKLGALFDAIVKLRAASRTGSQQVGVMTVEFSSTDVNTVTAAARIVVDAFEDLRMEE
jgi:hypothetical protein